MYSRQNTDSEFVGQQLTTSGVKGDDDENPQKMTDDAMISATTQRVIISSFRPSSII